MKIASAGVKPIFEKARALGRGVNMGNALDAPSEGAWGVTLREEDFTLVAEAGFDHVRIPTRWSAHALDQAPFTIDEGFAARVRWAVDSALAVGLRGVLNVHHYEGIVSDPDAHTERLPGLWRQIAQIFRGYPDALCFELLNEPHDRLTAEKNNLLIAATLAAVRSSHPDRVVVVGPVEYNAIRALPQLELPVGDDNLIVTFHYYDPFDFTHQGAKWLNMQNQIGTDWPGKVGTQRDIAAALDLAVAWAREHGRPLYMGEFGAIDTAEMGARLRWTKAVVQEADARSIPYAYWDLYSEFGLLDRETRRLRRPLLDAVLRAA